MNHKHLYYFWKVAKVGSVQKAAESINMTPQTLSGQIRLLEDNLGTALFSRQGRNLVLTEAGSLALEYAEEMFALSAELEQVLKHHPGGRSSEFKVGVSDAVPKSLAYQLLKPATQAGDSVRMICKEWQLDRLLTELSVHKLDLVLSDKPIPQAVSVRAYNHRLLESGVTFLGTEPLTYASTQPFPECLASVPLLLPGEDSAIRTGLDTWFGKHRIHPRIVGEFDDIALMIAFGRGGCGVFPIPTIIEDEFTNTGEFCMVGRTRQVKTAYFAISIERRLTHPCIVAITQSARQMRELQK